MLAGFVIIAVAVLIVLAALFVVAIKVRRVIGAPTIHWHASKATFRPEPHHWPLAAMAMYSADHRVWDTLAGINRGEAVQGLSRSWGIRDRFTLFEQLRDLLGHGHRSIYEPMIQRLSELPIREATDEIRRVKDNRALRGQDRDEKLWQTAAALTNRGAVKDVRFLAWDLVRFINLCALAIVAGYVDERRGYDLMLLAAHRLQSRYSGFEEMADHFVRARAFWAGGSKDQRPVQKSTERLVAKLASAPDSPWRYVTWSQSLPAVSDKLLDAP